MLQNSVSSCLDFFFLCQTHCGCCSIRRERKEDVWHNPIALGEELLPPQFQCRWLRLCVYVCCFLLAARSPLVPLGPFFSDSAFQAGLPYPRLLFVTSTPFLAQNERRWWNCVLCCFYCCTAAVSSDWIRQTSLVNKGGGGGGKGRGKRKLEKHQDVSCIPMSICYRWRNINILTLEQKKPA